MSEIKSKDTIIEVLVRKWLFGHGLRFRKNDSRYPGTPDIVLAKHKTVIFVHGCFWHQHSGCKKGSLPASNIDFWHPKLKKNVANDKLHQSQLKKDGWHVIVVWECETKDVNYLMEYLQREITVRKD